MQGDEILNGKILTTPYVESTVLNIVYADGSGTTIDLVVENGTAIVNGQEWFDKMEFILSVCSDSTECGGYINRWMGSPNPAFERAASFFHGHFEGLGYETHIMRVTDHLNPTQPESLNIIAWKEGRSDACVQGMGAHMDIAPPASPPAGGTYEGAYDNTAGTVAMMLYAKAFRRPVEFECDTFLALVVVRRGRIFAAPMRSQTTIATTALPQDKELRFYINMDMMGVSWPAVERHRRAVPLPRLVRTRHRPRSGRAGQSQK